ncbi:hypothetical protein [Streptomyces sp. NPDC058653]|uniref:hypothetical protein n=1 Tax=Streptomyces sp. NPDC058653 TaxID=3346576 RepID=UPI00365C8FA5
MAVTLAPGPNLRRVLLKQFRISRHTAKTLAWELGTSPGHVRAYLHLEIVPDPLTYLKLRLLLSVESDHADLWYIALLAQPQHQKRTSNIKKRHVMSAGAPDPLTAKSPEELVEKLREVYHWALRPSLRELEERTGRVLKRSTIHDMLHLDNKILPRFDRYAIFLEVCGVPDLSYWIAAWRELAPGATAPRVRMIEDAALARYEASVDKAQHTLSAS